MACTFILNGMKFNSELELDDYLFQLKKLPNKIKDIVFSLRATGRQGQVYNSLLKIQQESEQLRQKGEIYTALDQDINPVDPDSAEEVWFVKKPRVGVIDFLSHIPNIVSGKDVIAPIFNEEEYWPRRRKQLAEAETDITRSPENRLISDYDIPFIFPECSETDPKAYKHPNGKWYQIENIKTEEEFNKIKDRMTKIWKTQSLMGTAVHEVAKLFFKDVDSYGNKIFYRNDKQSIVNYILAQLSDKHKQYLTPEIIESTIEELIKLKDTVQQKYGNNCIFIPEIAISSNVQIEKNNKIVTGRIDLLVIDSQGNVHIFDFKCSPKNYLDYNDAKKGLFDYQLSTYKQMLRTLGINVGETSTLYTVPLKMENFHYDNDDDDVKYDKISGIDSSMIELSCNYGARAENIRDNIIEYFPDPMLSDMTSEEILTFVNDFSTKSFKTFRKQEDIDDDYIQDLIKNHTEFSEKDKNKCFVTIDGKRKLIKLNPKKNPEKDLKLQLKSLLRDKGNVIENTRQIKKLLIEGQRADKVFRYKANDRLDDKKVSNLWTDTYFQKYANAKWEVMEDAPEVLDQLGIILVKNIDNKSIDVIKISKRKLKRAINLGSKESPRKTILGTYQSDDIEYANSNSLVMESVEGNIELMETMAAINCLQKLFANDSAYLNEMTVVNPSRQESIQTTNKQLLYNFSKLCEKGKFQSNYKYSETDKGSIKLLSPVYKIQEKLKELIIHNKQGEYPRFSSIISCMPDIDKNITNTEILLQQLHKLRIELEKEFGLTGKINDTIVEEDKNPEIGLYRNVLYAIGELNGIDYRQQLRDHAKYLEGNIKDVVKNGWSGTSIDNPGTLQSQSLNKLAELTERAYQNTRESLMKFQNSMQDVLKRLKERKGFNWLEKVTFGNQSSIYRNLYDEEYLEKGELMFKNPYTDSSLLEEEKEFLIFSLVEFAKNRKGITNKEDFMDELQRNPEEILRVPLSKGSFQDSVAMNKSFFKAILNKLKLLNPKYLKQKIKENINGFYSDQEIDEIRQGEVWEMSTNFDHGENPETRATLLTDVETGKSRLDEFDINVESLLLKHHLAYNLKDNMNQIFPILKSIGMHLNYQGIVLNEKFSKDLEYLKNYVTNKIFNKPIEDTKTWGTTKWLTSKAMMSASKIALAFDPHQLYQNIDGFWKAVSLCIRKPDGSLAFTQSHFRQAYKDLLGDVIHFGDSKTKGELLCLQYGINDMDMNTIADKIKTDNAGIFNFWSLGFRFTSRPDYYNRMSILYSRMMADGCYEAHSVDSKGNLVYDWTLDKRYSEFAKGNKSHPDYNKQKAAYIRAATDLVNENAKNVDGSDFKFDVEAVNKGISIPPLPKAYTTKESESIKALADKIYGYYTHERKAMIQSYTIGGLLMQMNTFWSSKKNQYLARHGFTQEGDYEDLVETTTDENGNEKQIKYYMRYDEETNRMIPIADIPENNVTEEERKIPAKVWRGRPQEGIILTGAKLFKYAFVGNEDGEKGFSTAWNEIWNNNDPKLRKLYRANLGQLLYDLLMFLLIGCLIAPALLNAAKEHNKNSQNSDILTAMSNNMLISAAEMLDTSTDDFNAVKSIFGRGVNWTPFSISTINRVCTTFGNVLGGDADTFDALINLGGATRHNKPLMDYVKIQMTGRSIGQKE